MSLLAKSWLKLINLLAKTSTGLYYTFIWLLAYLGCAYLLLFPLLAVFFTAGLIWHIYSIPLTMWQEGDYLVAIGMLIISVSASWVTITIYRARPETPAGRTLSAHNFPMLIDRINQLSKSYNSPRIHRIKLTPHFRTEIIRTPTTGFPSAYINTLLIGLPVMSCMSPLHLKLLLAREIGHLAKSNHDYSRRILYLRNIWTMYDKYYKRSYRPDFLIMRLFFSWYAPLFNLTTLVAARYEHYIKDKCMLESANAELASEAITTFLIKKRYVNNIFWKELYASAFKTPKPPYLPYSSMNKILIRVFDKQTAQRYYVAEMNTPGIIDRETPNLKKRLLSLGYDNYIIPEQKNETAAQHFLGEQINEIQKQLDNIWYLKNIPIWKKRYHRGVADIKRLKNLREQAACSLLSNTESKEYLLLIEQYLDIKLALPLYYEILKTNSMDSEVCYTLGKILLNADDAYGVGALKLAMDLNRELTTDCCHKIVGYLVSHGRDKDALQYRRTILEYQVSK